jgi:hypothetical protein
MLNPRFREADELRHEARRSGLYMKVVGALSTLVCLHGASRWNPGPLAGNGLVTCGLGTPVSPHERSVLFALPLEAEYLEVTGVFAGDDGQGLEGSRLLRKGRCTVGNQSIGSAG